MSESLQTLVETLQPEKLDKSLFRGVTWPLRWKRVFGGQVLAQSMFAAIQTIEDPHRRVHSQHAYFLRPGDPDKPIIYEVDPIRDGRSFSTRRVVARQDDQAIFNTSLSFQIPEAGGDYQAPMPEVIECATDEYNHFEFTPSDGDWFVHITANSVPYRLLLHHHPCELENMYLRVEYRPNPNLVTIG